jgi:hypothetical protein
MVDLVEEAPDIGLGHLGVPTRKALADGLQSLQR